MQKSKIQIKGDSLWNLIAPAASDTLVDWAFYAALGLTAVAAYIESLEDISKRAEIVHDALPMCLTLSIGGLAAVFAAVTIFASLSSKGFRSLVRDFDYLVSVFAWVVALLLCAIVVEFFVLISSYSSWVAANAYFWVLVFGQLLVLFGTLQLFDAFRIILLQIVSHPGDAP